MTYTYTITEYVAGFMFSKDKKKVALILKNRPMWQRGMKNGIGGHVEPNEMPSKAMVREFEEETGLRHTDWGFFCTLNGPWGKVHFYKSTGDLTLLRNMTDECICIHDVSNLHNAHVVPNLLWLIPMALDKDSVVAEVEETGGLEPGQWTENITTGRG